MIAIANLLSNSNWGKRARAILVLCATAPIVLPAQTVTTVFSFDGSSGANPSGGVVPATDGNLYGTTTTGGANGYGTIFKMSPGRAPSAMRTPIS